MVVQSKRLKRKLFRITPVVAALAVLLVSLVLVSDVQQDASGYNRQYLWVLVLTIIALALLFVAILLRVVSLFRKVREEAPGARLSARWVRNFILLSLPPALIVYFFSAYFLTRVVDNWFNVEVEAALADSLQLGQEFLDTRTLQARNQLRRLGQTIDTSDSTEDLRLYLLANTSASGPVELSILDANGSIITTAGFSGLTGLPERPGDYALIQAGERGEYAAAEPAGDGGLMIRVIQQIPASGPGQTGVMLQAIYPLPPTITGLMGSIEQEYHRYQNVSYLRESLKQSFLLILSLVLLLTVLMAVLAALSAARRMVAPISRLADATRQVAKGDLAQVVATGAQDELGFLAQSFNEMTEALTRASHEAERGRARLQAQGEYLETVLGSLNAGVLTVNAKGVLVRINKAAEQILGLPAGSAVDRELEALSSLAPDVDVLTSLIREQVRRGRTDWQREIRLERTGTPLVLLVRGSQLPSLTGDDPGHVVVFDDVTVLNQAQREAAWAEVARRMAHEVKNPLTPIRLAAERLRMKLMDKLESRDAEMLDKSATTIVSQVEALRKLVDAFRDYASEPEFERAPLKLDRLVSEVVDLYRQADPLLKIELELVDGPDGLAADGGQIRQLLHNLIRNASEATTAGEDAAITVRSNLVDLDGKPWLELEVIDRGPGFPESVLAQPFEPYLTNKPKGSGLGLAICRKIAVDHNGTIEVSNRETGGARAIVRLPLGRGGEDSGRAKTGT